MFHQCGGEVQRVPYLVNGFCGAEHDKRKPSRSPSVGVCLHIYALNLTVLGEVFPQLLCGGEDTG